MVWYDGNDVGNFNNVHDSGDSSELFKRKLVVKVREKLKPVFAYVNPEQRKFKTTGVSTTVPVTLGVDLNGNMTQVGLFDFRYELFNAENPNSVVSYSIDGEDVQGPQSEEGSSSSSVEVDFDEVPAGEYFVELEVRATKGDAVLYSKASDFFRVVSSNVNLVINLIDPENELNLSTMSLKAFAVATLQVWMECRYCQFLQLI